MDFNYSNNNLSCCSNLIKINEYNKNFDNKKEKIFSFIKIMNECLSKFDKMCNPKMIDIAGTNLFYLRKSKKNNNPFQDYKFEIMDNGRFVTKSINPISKIKLDFLALNAKFKLKNSDNVLKVMLFFRLNSDLYNSDEEAYFLRKYFSTHNIYKYIYKGKLYSFRRQDKKSCNLHLDKI